MGRGSHFEPETEDDREELKDECGDEACDDWVLEEPVHKEVLVCEGEGLRCAWEECRKECVKMNSPPKL